MKRKKSRHKRAAVAFLANISLEGYPEVLTEDKKCSTLTTAALNTADPIRHHQHNEISGVRKTQLSDATNILIPTPTPCEQTNICDKFKDATFDKLLDGCSNHWLQLMGYYYENTYPLKTNSNIVCNLNTSLRDSRVSNLETNTSGNGITWVISPKQRQLKPVVSDSSLRDITTVKSAATAIRPASVKCLVISSGPRQSARSLFSVLQYTRAVSNKIGQRTSNASGAVNATLELPLVLSHCNGGASLSAIHGSVSNTESLAQHLSAPTGMGKPFTNSTISPANSCTSDPVRTASVSNQTNFARPTGDEVISAAAFLRQFCHPSFSTPRTIVPRPAHNHDHHHCCHQSAHAPGCSDLGCLATAKVAAAADPNGQALLRSGGGLVSPGQASRIGSEEVACEMLPLSPLRSRLDSTPAGPQAGSPQSPSQPEPLLQPVRRYLPNLLDDPDLLVATGKRQLQLPGYLATLLTYVRPSEQKRNVNLEFHSRFPSVQLTLTKLRSLKADIVQTVHKLSFDLWIAAHAHVLFEKLVLKLLVNKLNRKAYSSAALLISAKLNDIKGPELSSLIQEIEGMFRISRRDLLYAEVEVFFSLEFDVIPSDPDILPHYLRIHRDIDVAPLVPIGCINRNLLQLTLTSLIDNVVVGGARN